MCEMSAASGPVNVLPLRSTFGLAGSKMLLRVMASPPVEGPRPPGAAAGPDDPNPEILRFVHQPTGFLAETGHIVLLRPDRYVAAVIPLDRLAVQSARLEALVAATFS